MNSTLLNLALTITILVNTLYASNSVSESKNGIRVIARTVSSNECKTLFGKDLRLSRIYPTRFSIRNETNLPISVSIRDMQVLNAYVLTKESIQSSISTGYVTGCVCLFLFFPLSFFIYYNIKSLTELLAIVAKHGFTYQMVEIQPGATFDSFVFPQYRLPETEYLKDASGNRLRDANGKELPGNTPPFVAPKFIVGAVTFSTNNAWFNFKLGFSAPV